METNTSAPTLEAPRADTTARELVQAVPVVPLSGVARDARSAAMASAGTGLVYVIDEAGALRGLLKPAVLLALPDQTPISRYVEAAPVTVNAGVDQEQVALAAVRYGLSGVPVSDEGGRFLGIVPASTLLRVQHQERVEDLDRLAGILRRNEHAIHLLDESPARRVRERLPWLIFGLIGSAIATGVMARFERFIERNVAVAFFVPGIVYLADAVGTQTEAIAVRSLSFRHPRGFKTFIGELRTGLLLGIALGVPVLPAVWLAFGDVKLGAAVCAAVIVASATASAVGFALPFALSRAGQDPAFGSGPVATVIQDILSLLAYFAAVRVFGV